MNYLGIDYGEKRIGLAKADGQLKIATPLDTIVNDAGVFDRLREIVLEESISTIVVGLPMSFDGRENAFAGRIRAFAAKLQDAVGKPVVLENEIFSSKIAEESSPGKLDQSAAAVILQSFLDKK
ncbi:MAG: Holliday junction resolvase RuvX [Patescibacteria group bacterium]